MSVQYLHYLVPEDMWHVPPTTALERLLEALLEDGWIDKGKRGHRQRYVNGTAEPLKSLNLQSVVPDMAECLKVEASESIGFTRSFSNESESEVEEPRLFREMPPGTPLSSDWCWAVGFLISKRLRLVPAGEMPGVLGCTKCQGDLMTQLVPHETDPFEPDIEAVLKRCAHCDATVDLSEVARTAEPAVDGSPSISERSPFFRFALELTSDSPPEDPAATDPTLERRLRDCTGVSYRVFGRWS